MGCLGAFLGACLGAVIVTLLTFPWQLDFLPHVPGGQRWLGDGQYILIIFYTIPQGAVVGTVTGWATAEARKQRPKPAALIRLAGGLLIVGYFLNWGYSSGSHTVSDLIGGTLAYWGVPVLWALGLAISGGVGLYQLRKIT